MHGMAYKWNGSPCHFFLFDIHQSFVQARSGYYHCSLNGAEFSENSCASLPKADCITQIPPDTQEECTHSQSSKIYWCSHTICIFGVMFSFNRKSIHIPLPLHSHTENIWTTIESTDFSLPPPSSLLLLLVLLCPLSIRKLTRKNEKKYPLKMSIF